MNEIVKLLNALKEHFTEEEYSIVLKATMLEGSIKESILKDVSPIFLKRYSEVITNKYNEFLREIDESTEESEEYFILKGILFTLSADKYAKEIEGYSEFEEIAKRAYEKYNINFEYYKDTLIPKFSEILSLKEGLKIFMDMD